MSLHTAPPEVQLAVDLILLLEQNQIPTQTVLAALAIVQADYEKKQAVENSASAPSSASDTF